MKKLSELVTIRTNNEDCVVLQVKENMRYNLIDLGCFDGNEEIIRLTKGRNHTATVFTKDNSFSWNWGEGGYTLVSDKTSKCGKLIQECIEEDFGIYIGNDVNKIQETLHIMSLDDLSGTSHVFKLMWWKEQKDTNIVAHYDGEFLKGFEGYDKAIQYMNNNYASVDKIESYIAHTGCYVETYNVYRK